MIFQKQLLFHGGAFSVALIPEEIESETWVQAFDEAICVSIYNTAIRKGMNSSVFSSAMGK